MTSCWRTTTKKAGPTDFPSCHRPQPKSNVSCAYAGLAPDVVLGEVPTREVVVTAEHAAINAVMAGCKVEYFPAVVAAVRAHLDPMGNCHSTTGTLSGAAQVVVINGPIRNEIGVHSYSGCFGPGFRANATIGRALRLVIRNVCRAIPGFLDRASFSWPLRYSFCFGENEEASNWTPLHVQRGYRPDQSTATVFSIMKFAPSAICIAAPPRGSSIRSSRTLARTAYSAIHGSATTTT